MRNLPIHALLAAALTLGGCGSVNGSWIYKIDVQQGNVITQDMVDKLKPGMTANQVRYVMGSPSVVDAFHSYRWDYVYSRQVGGGKRTQERLSLYFKDGVLASMEGDFHPRPADAIAQETPKETTVTVPEGAIQKREQGFFSRLWGGLTGSDENPPEQPATEQPAADEAKPAE